MKRVARNHSSILLIDLRTQKKTLSRQEKSAEPTSQPSQKDPDRGRILFHFKSTLLVRPMHLVFSPQRTPASVSVFLLGKGGYISNPAKPSRHPVPQPTTKKKGIPSQQRQEPGNPHASLLGFHRPSFLLALKPPLVCFFLSLVSEDALRRSSQASQGPKCTQQLGIKSLCVQRRVAISMSSE